MAQWKWSIEQVNADRLGLGYQARLGEAKATKGSTGGQTFSS